MKTTKIILEVFVVLNINVAVVSPSECSVRQSEHDVFLYGFLMESSKVDTLSTCTSKCKQNKLCTSINMNLMSMTCELNNSTKRKHPRNVTKQLSMIYMEVRDSRGFSPENPIQSCKWLKNLDSQAESGVYWMKFNDSSSTPFQVFCEMTIDGGGWTLVYRYTFTQYSNFRSGANAVTPIPNWPVDKSIGTWVPESTTTPLSESSYSAMDFALWKKIGSEFLIKSNITNWVACVEGTGSLVNWVSGSVTCRVVKAITSPCTNIAPNKLIMYAHCGVGLHKDNLFQYFLEGRNTISCWPVHDPCGTSSSSSNHITNVKNPSGAVYIR